jgi:hypothetical protein
MGKKCSPFLVHPDMLDTHTVTCSRAAGTPSLVVKWLRVKLTNYLHLRSKLRVSGATPLCPLRVFIHSFIVFCLTTGPKPPPKRFLHIARSRASSFKGQHPLPSPRPSSSLPSPLPHLPVFHLPTHCSHI